MQLGYRKYGTYFHICDFGNCSYSYYSIAKAIKMPIFEFENYVKHNFNGIINIDSYLIFPIKEDVENALEWIESVYIANQLSEK
jgi:enolase